MDKIVHFLEHYYNIKPIHPHVKQQVSFWLHYILLHRPHFGSDSMGDILGNF